MSRVAFLDLARENMALEPELLEATSRVIRSGHVLYGPEVEAFEQELCEYFGVSHAVGLASGTSALQVALMAIDPGVAPLRVTAMTAPATANAADQAHRRACPRFSAESPWTMELLDIDPGTRNAIGADVHVQLYGLATDATGAMVEDIAHAMGATVHGKKAGTMARVGAASFYPSKLLGALGDGGALITNDAEVAARARRIRHYGHEDGNGSDINSRGLNSRLCEIQSAWLRIKLRHLPVWIERRRAIAARYNDELLGRVIAPAEPPGHAGVYHVYAVEHPERDRIVAGLRERGVGVMVHYSRCLHQYRRWSHLAEPGTLPNAERLAREVLSLPCFPFLRDDEQDAVIKAVKELT